MKRSLVLSVLAFLSVAAVSMRVVRADETAAAAPATANKVDWEHMNFDQRKKLMKTTVMPELKKAFQAYDAKKYKKFTCETCHGDGATDGKFKMPNAKLPKLPTPGDQAAFMALQQKKPEATKFMATVVAPKVSGLLGLAEWSPKNPKGFGCYGCHTSEAAK
jgi:hypothetical protein